MFVPASLWLLLCCTQTEGVKQKLGGHSDNPGQRQWWLRGEPQLWGGKWYQQEGWVARAQEKQESEGACKGLDLSTGNNEQMERIQNPAWAEERAWLAT